MPIKSGCWQLQENDCNTMAYVDPGRDAMVFNCTVQLPGPWPVSVTNAERLKVFMNTTYLLRP